MKYLLQRLFAAKTATRTSARKPRTARLSLEQLEDRQVLSAFSQVGDQLLVTGTGGNDRLRFSASRQQVTLNDETFTVDPAQIHSIAVDAAGGKLSAYLVDTVSSVASFISHPGSATLTGSTYTLSLTGASFIYLFGKRGANMSAMLYGSTAGQNIYGTWGDFGDMQAPGYWVHVERIKQVTAFAGTAADVANMRAPNSGHNVFIGNPGRPGSELAGDNYVQLAYGFTNVNAYSGADYAARGGDVNHSVNEARLYGGTSDTNYFIGGPAVSWMTDGGHTYYLHAYGFADVQAYSGTASDYATLYGSTASANDFTYDAGSGNATMMNLKADSLLRVYDFSHVTANSGTLWDTATLYGSQTVANRFTLTPTYGSVRSGDHVGTAVNFSQVSALGGTTYGTAADTAVIYCSPAGYGDMWDRGYRFAWGVNPSTGGGYWNTLYGSDFADYHPIFS